MRLIVHIHLPEDKVDSGHRPCDGGLARSDGKGENDAKPSLQIHAQVYT